MRVYGNSGRDRFGVTSEVHRDLSTMPGEYSLAHRVAPDFDFNDWKSFSINEGSQDLLFGHECINGSAA